MAQLNNCPHCGATTEFVTKSNTIWAQCIGCKIQTQPLASSLEYSAKDRVAKTWNSALNEEWPEWVQPTGAHDAYSKSSKVSYSGGKWISNIDSNVWAPGVTGWTKQQGGTK